MLKRLAQLAAALLLIVLVWLGVSTLVSAIRHVHFPGPGETAANLVRLASGEDLCQHSIYRHVVDSLSRWAFGFSIAAVLGTLYGLIAGWYHRLEAITVPIVHVVQLVPGLAWLPVALLIFGVSPRSTIFMIAVTAFGPIALNVLAGIKQVDATYLRAADMLGARGHVLLLKVLLPGTLPHALTGLRVGLGNGWRVLVAAEMIVGSGTGLGYSIIQSRWTLDYTAAFSCIVVICLIGLAVEQLVFRPLEARTVERWGLPRSA